MQSSNGGEQKSTRISGGVNHISVLLHEVLEALSPEPGDFIIDGTLGAGGHAREIIKRISPGGTFLGIDWDERAAENTKKKLDGTGLKKFLVGAGNYRDLPDMLAEQNLGKADGVIIDLGFSSEQLASGKGFSFERDEPLLVTYSDEATPLYQLLPQLNEGELARVIRDFSDEKYAARIARAITEREKERRIETSGELAEVVRNVLPKQYGRGRIDPATRTFQALRMFTNDELGNLGTFLGKLTEILRPGGRAVIISFHSKEDRMVKHRFRELAKGGKASIITKKPMQATDEEVEKNPRSRSAKLRAIQLI